MKKLLIGLLTLGSLSALAQDMSRTESYDVAYKELADGSEQYVGSCLTHENYENVKFKRTAMMLKYMEPAGYSASEFNHLMSKIDKDLISKIAKTLEFDMADFQDFVDDITIDRIKVAARPMANLVRANVGIGGGNGTYLVFEQTGGTYKLMSITLDGGLEYCDAKFWDKRK